MKNSERIFEQNTRPFVFFLIVFAAATLIMKNYYLAAAEGVAILGLIIYSAVNRSRKRKALVAYIESVTYDATDEGDVVIDPCCGSGATLRAARELNRPSYGFEIDRVFYQRARDEMLKPCADEAQIRLEAY